MQASIEQRILYVIKQCSIHEPLVGSELQRDLEMDSLDIVELSLAVEDEFGIEIPGEHWLPMQAEHTTVRQVIDYVATRI